MERLKYLVILIIIVNSFSVAHSVIIDNSWTDGTAGSVVRAAIQSNDTNLNTFIETIDTEAEFKVLYNLEDSDITTLANTAITTQLGTAYDTEAELTSLFSGKQAVDADLTLLSAPTAWRLFYSNGTSAIAELTLGASGTVLTSNGASAAPSFTSVLTNPMTTAGDIIYGGVAGAPTRLAIGANNSIFGVNGSGTLGYYTNISISDSAYQFYDSVDTTKRLLFEIGGITTGTTRTCDPGDYDSQIPAATAVDATGKIVPSGITYFPVSIGVAASDETTDLTTGTAKVTFRAPYAFTLTAVRANVNTAPVGATLNIDVNEGGVSVLSTVITIDATEETSTTAVTPAVISDSAIADDAEITIDIDQIGSSTAGKGLKVWLIGTRTL